jgi:hypothetical protein
MARAHGKDHAFKIDDSGGTLRDISTHVTSVSGLPGTRPLSDATGAQATGESSLPGIPGATFTVNGWFDTAATTGSHTVLNGIRLATATSSFEYGPGGGAASAIKYSGECWLESLNYNAELTGTVSFEAQFKLDGALSVGTF